MTPRAQRGALIILALCLQAQIIAAEPLFDIDIKELEQRDPAIGKAPRQKKPKDAPSPPAKDSAAAPAKAPASPPAQNPVLYSDGFARYIVQSGDFRPRTLAKHLGLPEETGAALFPEILRLNNLSSARELLLGQTLLIPVELLEKAKRGAVEPGTAADAQSMVPGLPAEGIPAESFQRAPRQPTAPATPEAPPPAEPPDAPAAPPTPAPPSNPAAPPGPLAQDAPPAGVRPQQPTPAVVSGICSVTDRDPAQILDAFLNALGINWSRNRIIESGKGERKAFSVRVDRYFEQKGERYILSIGETDPYSYTLLRVLGASGYHVLQIQNDMGFRKVGEMILASLGIPARYEARPVEAASRAISGFFIDRDSWRGMLLVTDQAPQREWKDVMSRGCTGR